MQLVWEHFKLVLTREVRQQKLKALREDGDKADSKSKLYYKRRSSVHPVCLIDLDFLIYNRHNGRLESEMQTYRNEHCVGEDVYNEELHEQIETFLWDTNTNRNRRTQSDLVQKGQQRPGIVTLDGVIIDGNRRAMLLRRIEEEQNTKQYFEAIILPDAYDDDPAEIMRLETQYQMGEDAILDYGPLEKYLHAKQLKEKFNIEVSEIANLMVKSEREVNDLLGIMKLMDEYLEHIECAGLYNLLKEDGGGTKEGMFVDLYNDLNRLESGRAQIQWSYDEVDLMELKIIQFDHIRFSSYFSGTDKSYRAISHDGAGKKSFFAHENIWRPFSKKHTENINPITSNMGSLADYLADTDIEKLVDAAKARDRQWKDSVDSNLKENFGVSQDSLQTEVEQLEPRRLLLRAKNALTKINPESQGLVDDSTCREMVKEIGQLTFHMKKSIERFERVTK